MRVRHCHLESWRRDIGGLLLLVALLVLGGQSFVFGFAILVEQAPEATELFADLACIC